MDDQPKITLVEILVVVAIVALVGVLAAVAISAARSKERDATRLSNVRQVQSALEDYFNENNTYPVGTGLPLGDSSQSACLSVTGFRADCSSESVTLMRFVPRVYETGLSNKVACGNPLRKAFCYSVIKDGAGYGIEFELENTLNGTGLKKGINCASPGKMTSGACER